MSEAFVSLVTNDDYAQGAVVLGQSLRDVKTTKRLVILVTDTVSGDARQRLQSVWDELVNVETLESPDVENLTLYQRPELSVTLTKLHAWRLTRLSKCVFLDADTLVVQNVDELFQRPELSAAADVGWPDIFNSGVFVFVPSEKTFQALVHLANTEGSFDGGDQGLLNAFWPNWSLATECRLPFTFNMTVSLSYTYAAAYKKFGQNACILHFLGRLKPWHHSYDSSRDQVYMHSDSGPADRAAQAFVHRWWRVRNAWTAANEKHAEAAAGGGMEWSPLSQQTTTEVTSGAPAQVIHVFSPKEEEESRKRWEAGQPDFMGKDNYRHIEAHLSLKIQSKP